MSGLFAGTSLERPVTCAVCERPLDECTCPRDADGNVRRPQDQVARIRREKRKGGRIATVVDGLDPVASDLEGLAKALRQTLSAGGGVSDGLIVIQGDHRERVAQHLRERGYQVRMAGG